MLFACAREPLHPRESAAAQTSLVRRLPHALGVVISCIGIKIVLNKNAYLKTFGEDKEPGQEVETADEDEPKKNANFRDIAHM